MSRLTEYAGYGDFDYRCGIDRGYYLSAADEPARWLIRVEWRTAVKTFWAAS